MLLPPLKLSEAGGRPLKKCYVKIKKLVKAKEVYKTTKAEDLDNAALKTKAKFLEPVASIDKGAAKAESVI